jgi:hypothetical protein
MSRFFNSGSRVLRLVTAIVAVGSAHAVFLDRGEAATLTLDTGKSASLLPGGTGSFTFSATNDAGAIDENFLAWVIGVQILPAGGNVGSLTIGALTQPGTAPLPAGEVEASNFQATLASGASINGSTTYQLLSLAATEFLNTAASNSTYNLGTLSLTASGDAQGTWNVYAVQQGGNFYKTHWTDGGFEDIDFGNFPRGSSGSNTSLLLGIVSVVPEPGTLALAGSALAGVAWVARRIRRRGERKSRPGLCGGAHESL